MSRDLRRAIVSVAWTGAVLAVLALFLFGVRAAFSTAVGALLACGNLYVLGRVVAAMLGRGSGLGAWRLVGVIKMVALIVAVWLLLTKGIVDPIAFVVGLGALPLGLAIDSMRTPGRANEPPEEDDR
jgi:hypothetical protein